MSRSLPRPKKRLGQHFLVDQNVVRKIVALADLQPSETVLEIGPGTGALTRALCAAAGSVIAVELDAALAARLSQALATCSNLDLRVGDAMEFPYATLPEGTVVVSNLPYYLSTPVLFKLLAARGRIGRMVLMLQTEVARRLAAKPGTKDYGILSVLTQFWAVPQLAFRVSASCFRPRPEVGSTVISLKIRPVPPAQVADEPVFVATVRAAFAHRRKTLANSLRDEGWPADRVAAALERAKIQGTRRAETLTLTEFAALANALHQELMADG